MKIVGVSGGLGLPSSTSLLRDRLVTAVHDVSPALETSPVDLRDLALPMTHQLLTGFASDELGGAQRLVGEADGLIVVSPVFAGSYAGLFKTFFDLLEPGSLEGKPVLLAATGGSPRHSLVIDHAMRPLFSYLRAFTLPTGVYAATEDFASPDLQARIDRAAEALVRFADDGKAPKARYRSVKDQFENVTPFEQLLAQSAR